MQNFVQIEESSISLEEQVEASVIDMIKTNNPEWVESDGSCEKCMEYYERLEEMVEQDIY